MTKMTTYQLETPFAHGGPLGEAHFRSQLTDFNVREILGFEPEGQGEHHYVQISKRGVNTEWVAQKIAKFTGVKLLDVGFCGQKDRYGITSQWFSVYCPKSPSVDWSGFGLLNNNELTIESFSKGSRKLRRGQHQSNQFSIILRAISSIDVQLINEKLMQIRDYGVPNYFGEQRFGRNQNNLVAAKRWLEDKVPLSKLGSKGMIMSAARSYIFNLVLAERVRQGSWQSVLEGDSSPNATGPLWGRGRPLVNSVTLELETQILAPHQEWLNGLEHCGLSQERRELVMMPQNLSWQMNADSLQLDFGLAPGQFATALLREVFALVNLAVDAP
jgi:tRNA pseudouridine13 synthase